MEKMAGLKRGYSGNQTTIIDFVQNNGFRRITYKPIDNKEKKGLLPIVDPKDQRSYFKTFFNSIQTIGEGSFGKVSSAKLFLTGKEFAVKRPEARFTKSKERLSMLREVMWHEMLSPHPNICTFHYAWEQFSKIYILSELCQKSLEVVCLSDNSVSTKTIWKYMIDILMGLQYLHANRLIHMDVKPANILIDFEDVCKISDFGLVCEENDSNADNRCDGDGKYMALEVLQDETHATSKSDIYAFGVTMLELVAEKDLFNRDKTYIDFRNGKVDAEFLFNMPREMQEIIVPAFSVDTATRPTAVDMLSCSEHMMLPRQFKVFEQYKTAERAFDGNELKERFDAEQRSLLESFSKAQNEERKSNGLKPRKLFNNTI